MGDQLNTERREPLPDGWVALVDDDASVRTALGRVLRARGLEVGTFATAQEYLDASRARGAACCLVLDVHLGGESRMSGLELHDHLAAGRAGPPIILITAHDEVPTEDLTRRVGTDGYLRKPFDGDALVASVRRALEGVPAGRGAAALEDPA